MKTVGSQRMPVGAFPGAWGATRATVSTFGAGLASVEHGIGETLQGNVAPRE